MILPWRDSFEPIPAPLICLRLTEQRTGICARRSDSVFRAHCGNAQVNGRLAIFQPDRPGDDACGSVDGV
jgi:hypothetical protein